MNEDTNAIIYQYLIDQDTLTDIVGTRIYNPALPENVILPAISFLTIGGLDDEYIPGLLGPSIQFDCWAKNEVGLLGPKGARKVYRALHAVLQGKQNKIVSVGGTNYKIKSSRIEVSGQDMQDVEVPTMFRVRTSFAFIIDAE